MVHQKKKKKVHCFLLYRYIWLNKEKVIKAVVVDLDATKTHPSFTQINQKNLVLKIKIYSIKDGGERRKTKKIIKMINKAMAASIFFFKCGTG